VIDRAVARKLYATSAVEFAGVVLGLAYVLLIYRRNRMGWVAGAASSVCYVYLAASAHLPMQSALQFYYVAWRSTVGSTGRARPGSAPAASGAGRCAITPSQ